MAVRSITDTLRALRGGAFLDEASDMLADLVKTVDSSGKPGKLTMELTVKRAGRGSTAMIVADKLELKKPKEEASVTTLFGTPEGNLLAEDPRQQRLELTVVPEDKSTLVKIDNH